MITITDAAKAHYIAQMRKANKRCMTMALVSSGCNGYGFNYTFNPGKQGSTIFEWTVGEGEAEELFEFFVEPDAALYLDEGIVDLHKEGLNRKLSYDMPLMTGSCGCGKSFSF
jgi:Fe-S cluster assembly iron-binding protein IscA